MTQLQLLNYEYTRVHLICPYSAWFYYKLLPDLASWAAVCTSIIASSGW